MQLSGKRLVRESSCLGKVLSGKCLVWETSVRESDCPGNVRYPSGLTHAHSHFMALFPGPPRCAGARRNLLLGFYGAREENRSRHTDHPDEHHSIRTNQQPTCHPPIFTPDVFCATTLPLGFGQAPNCWLAYQVAWTLIWSKWPRLECCRCQRTAINAIWMKASKSVSCNLYILNAVRCPYIRTGGRGQLSSEWCHNENDVTVTIAGLWIYGNWRRGQGLQCSSITRRV